MKSSILLAAGLLAGAASFGQSRGQFFLGGSVNYSNTDQSQSSGISSNTSENDKVLTATPRIGYFVSDRLAIGAEVSLQNSKSEVTDMYFAGTVAQRTTTVVGGLFVRPYWSIGKNFFVFAQGGLNYMDLKVKQKSGSGAWQQVIEGNGFNMVVFPGVSYTYHKRLMLEVGLRDFISLRTFSYKSSTSSPSSGKSSTTNFSIAGNLAMSAGIHVLIGK